MGIDTRVRVFTRPGCHLCEEVGQMLARLDVEPMWVNIDEQAEWWLEYNEWVPVVEILGRVRFRGLVNEALLRRIVTTELKGKS